MDGLKKEVKTEVKQNRNCRMDQSFECKALMLSLQGRSLSCAVIEDGCVVLLCTVIVR